VHTKDLCWPVGTIYDPRELPGASTAGPEVDEVLHLFTPDFRYLGLLDLLSCTWFLEVLLAFVLSSISCI
jgi:cytochrome c biogenesis protein ResB